MDTPAFDHNLFAEALAQVPADEARHDVVAAAGRLRHDDADRL